MKKILRIIIIFVCIIASIVLTEEKVHAADPATIYMRDVQFSTKKDGEYYSSKEELLENTPEKTNVTSVYIKATLEASANGDNRDVEITSVSGLSATYSKITDAEGDVKLGPISASLPEQYRKLTVNYNYKYDENGKEKTGNGTSTFTVNSAKSFDGTDYGKSGNDPTGEIVFEVSGGSGGSEEASSSHQVYRYDQSIKLKVKVADKGQDDIGVKSVEISGDFSTTKELNPPKAESTVEITTIAQQITKYEDIENLSYSATVTDGAEKSTDVGPVTVSDYILKEHKVDAEIIPVSEFKPYVENDEVVIEFKVTYGQEFLKGISSIQATTPEVYVSISDTDRVSVVEEGEGNYNRVYKVRTKKKPTDKTQSVFLNYENNNGGDAYTELSYTISNELAQGYEFDYESTQIQKFDITNGNLWVDDQNIAHYGKVISGLAGEQNIEADESTVTCKDIIMITGSTDKYVVKIDKEEKQIIFDKELNITNSSNDGTYPVKIKGGTTNASSVIMLGKGTIKATNAKSAIYIDGGTVNFYKNGEEGEFKIESTNGAGIAINGSGKIGINQIYNLNITAGGDGAGIGTEANGEGGEVYVVNSPLKIAVTGGGAAIGTGKGGKLTKVKVEGTKRKGSNDAYYGDNQTVDLKVDSGACIGAAGDKSSISGAVDVNNIAGLFTVGGNGVAIGAASSGTCGNITANSLRIKIAKNSTTAGAGIGAGNGATCGDITVSGGAVEIDECTVGVGADNNATCGNITINTEAEIKVSKGDVGIGARESAKMGNIKILSNKNFSQVDLKTTKVGIGSVSANTESSNVEFTCKSSNYTNKGTEQAEIVINGPAVCIGASDSGKIGNININYCNKVVLTPASGGVGIGAKGTSSKTKEIKLKSLNVWVDSCDIGIGGSGTVGNITIDSCAKVVAKSSKIGMGSSLEVGNITVMWSSVQMGYSSSESEIGIGVSTGAKMGNISIKNRSNVKIYAKKIGIGSSSNETTTSSIKIEKGSSSNVGGSTIEIIGVSDVGIGTTGKIGLIEVKGNKGTKTSKIKIKTSGDGKGIGIGASGTCGDIIVATNAQIGESSTKCKIGIGSSGTCGKIEVREGNNVVNDVVIYASDMGIGFVGSTASNGSSKIDIRNVKLDIRGCTVGIGTTSGAVAGEIEMSTLSEVDGDVVDVDVCGIKVVPTTSGIGIGGSGTCGDIKCTGIPIQIGSSDTKCTVGIGTLAGTVGDINITTCSGIKVYATDIGIGSGTNNTSEKSITISGSDIDIDGVNVGIGTKGKLNKITIGNNSNIVITPNSNGLGIGTMTSAKVGDINISNTDILVNNCAIGIGTSGECGKIKMAGCKNVVLKSSTLGVGGTSKADAIILESSNFQIGQSSRKSTVGIGTTTGVVSDILIGNCKAKIYANDVGIGSKSASTGNASNMSGIITYITKSTVHIAGSDVGIGANGGNLGPIMIGNMELTGAGDTFQNGSIQGSTKIKITGQSESTSVGVGSMGGACVNICFEEVDADISNVSIGIGTNNKTELIKIYNNSQILVDGNDVGIGVKSANDDTNIYIQDSSVDIKEGIKVGIGTSASGELNDIEISNSHIRVNAGVGVGGLGEVYQIILKDSTQVDIGGGTVAIGVGGDNGQCNRISIEECPSILAYGSKVCIGNDSNLSNSGGCTIDINSSKVKVAGNGVGIGGTTKGIYTIEIGSNSTIIANTGSTGIGGGLGECDDISISESEIKVNTATGGAGIGGVGTVGGITIVSSTINVTTTLTGLCIGGNLVKGDILISGSNITTNSKDGIGIGGNSFGTYKEIVIGDSELDINITGAGSGIGNNENTLSSIYIENSGIKINGGSGAGVGIGSKGGVVSDIDLSNNVISILKNSGSTGAGIGSGAEGNVGNITLDKNKVVVATGDGAGIGSGSGSNSKVTGTIKILDGVIIGKSVNGACIGAGKDGYVLYIAIVDGKINARTTGTGACIGAGSGSIGTLRIDKGEIVCNAESSTKGISSSSIIVGNSTKPVSINNGDINISVNSVNGNAITGDEITINDGYIEVVSSGANGIEGTTSITINKGVVKAKGNSSNSNNKDIKGGSITISRNANVEAYNNKTSGVIRSGKSLEQRKITTDFWRNYDGIVEWTDGNSSGKIKTDSSGDIYFWYNESTDKGMIFNMAGKKMVI